MRITKFGHSCLLVEDGKARILIDPGAFSRGFEDLRELDAVLITQSHPDHFVPEQLAKVFENNPAAKLYADETSAKTLTDAGTAPQTVRAGDEFEVAGRPVAVFGKRHIMIHPDMPVIPNVGYFIGGRLFHPGDAYTVPPVAVEILAAPAAGPWLKVEEAIDYVRAVRPRRAFPIHDAVLSDVGLDLHHNILKSFGEAGEFRVLEQGVVSEF